MDKIKLPLGDHNAYYEIRLESIGGLGANLCGKMLGELGVKYLNLNSTSFSSYGSEKTGTPVRAYIRYCESDKEIRLHSPVVAPQLLVVFHQALLGDEGIWEGCSENTQVLLALDGGEAAEDKLSVPVKVKECYGINAQQIAIETRSRINTVMLGAMAAVMGFIPPDAVERICEDTIGKKYPDALKGNLQGIRRGLKEVKRIEVKTKASSCNREKEVHWGYRTAPIGGINPRLGSTVVSDLAPSRQGYIPVFIKERCINCGLCHTACPDMVFQFEKGEYKGREMMVNRGLDYYHCKGCLRCVEVCPVNALVQGVEAEHPQKTHFMVNQELLRQPSYYLEAGADGYITSESYLTEKRMEGGEV